MTAPIFTALDLTCPTCSGDTIGDRSHLIEACGCPDCNDRDRHGCGPCNATGSLESGCEVCGCIIGDDCSAEHDDTVRGFTATVDGERVDVCGTGCLAAYWAQRMAAEQERAA